MTRTLDSSLRDEVAQNSKAVDKGELQGRYVLPALGEAGQIAAGYRTSADVIYELSAEDLSVGFTTWATRMTLEYLQRADTEFAQSLIDDLASGRRPGVSGMAGAFKEFAGVGELDLSAERDGEDFIINGRLGWASNLYDDAIVVTGAKTAAGERVLFAFEAGLEGVEFGKPFGLLGLNSTQSSWVNFDNVRIPAGQVLTDDFDTFMAGVRPVFVVMQIAECLGVAEASISAASTKLDGLKATFSDDVDLVRAAIDSARQRWDDVIAKIESGDKVDPEQLLVLRLDAANAAVDAANIEVRVAGGAGYAQSTPASRRYREASFLPVQSPSEAQLRFELLRVREGR